MANQQVNIAIRETGGAETARTIRNIGSESQITMGSVSRLRSVLYALGAAATVRGLEDMLNSLGDAQNRLGFVSKSSDETAAAMKRLFQVADASRTSFDTTVNLYSRIAFATKNMGFSHEDAARAVQTLNESVILSGASTREANSAVIQFTQGLARGTIQGRELNSLMRELPTVSQLIADKLGVTVGALRQLGTQGNISAKVMMQALLDASSRVDQSFGKTAPTIGQAITLIKNKITEFVKELNDRFQIMPRITALMQVFGDHMEVIGRVVLAGVFAAGVAVAVVALNTLTASILANPLGLLAVAVVAAVAAIVTFSDHIRLTSSSVATLADFFKALWVEVKGGLIEIGKTLRETFTGLSAVFKQVFGSDFEFSVKGLITTAAKLDDTIVGFFRGMAAAAAVAFEDVPTTVTLVVVTTMNKLIEFTQIGVNKIIEVLNNNFLNTDLGRKLGLTMLDSVTLSLIKLPEVAKAQGDKVAAAFAKGFSEQHAAQDMIGRVFAGAEKVAQDRLKSEAEKNKQLQAGQDQFGTKSPTDPNAKGPSQLATDDVIQKLKEQAAALQGVSIERRVNNDLIKIEYQLRAKGIQLTEQEKSAIVVQLQENEALKLKAKLTEEISGKLEDNALEQKALNDIIAKGTDHLAAYVAKLNELKIQQLEANRDLVSGFKAGFLEMQNTMSDFGKQGAKVVTDAFGGMENAVVNFVKTGKMNWSSLTDTIMADLMKIVMNQAIMSVIGAIGGSGSGFGGMLAGLVNSGSGLAGARAEGGSVSPGKAYLVGERGPEIFQPGAGGQIVPNHMIGGAQPQVNVHVVNVSDPNEIANALNHPDNQDVVVNVIRRNKGAIKSALGM